MKTQRRRGFTVVELVVVIAIIAVLAAVLIPTFTSIIKKANDSAYLQERQSKQIEDLAEKVDKINYFTWEDFEKKLAEELAKVDTTGLNKAELNAAVTSAVTEAMKQYQGEHAGDNTGLTEAQVQKIVDEAMKSQLTTAQVEAIVNQAVAKVGGVNAADVQAIVRTAIAGMGQTGLNAKQVRDEITKAINESKLANKTDVANAISAALENFETLTAQQVENIVKDALSESKKGTVYLSGSDELTETNTTYILRTSAPYETVTLTVKKGIAIQRIIVDAPNVKTVNIVYANGESAKEAVELIEVINTAVTSTHINVDATSVEVSKGRAVVGDNAAVKVTNIKATPSTNADVIIELETGATVENPVVAEYQDNGTGTNDTIKVIDHTANASVVLSASAELSKTNTTTTNVVVEGKETGTTSTTVSAGTNTTNVVLVAEVETTNTTTGETTNTTAASAKDDFVASIGSTGYTSLDAALEAAKDGDTVVLLKSVSEQAAILVYRNLTIDGSGNTITFSGNRGIRVAANDVDLTVKNVTLVGGSNFERALQVDSDMTGVTININNVNATATYYTVNICAGVTVELNITNSKLYGWAALNIWSDGVTIDATNSTLNGLNDKTYDAAGWNNFCTICLEGDTTGSTPLHASDMKITLTNCTVTATATTGNKQSLVGFNHNNSGGALNNIVEMTGCTLSIDNEDNLFYDNGTKNQLIIGSSTLNGKAFSINYETPLPDTWYSNAAFNTTKTGGMNVTFAQPFEKGWMCDGEGVILTSNVTLSADVNCQMTSGTFYLYFGGHTISGGKIVLNTGVSVISDTSGMSSVFGGTVNEIDNGDGTWKYIKNDTIMGEGQNPANTPGPNPSFPPFN